MNKLIVVSEETKGKLDGVKIHPRQSYNEAILTLIMRQKEMETDD